MVSNPFGWFLGRKKKNKTSEERAQNREDKEKSDKELTQVIQTLAEVPLLSNLTTDQIKNIASEFTSRTYTNKQNITTQGEFGDEFFVITKGCAIVSINDEENGGEKEITKLKKLDYFGEQALLTNDKRSAHIRADGPLEVLVLNRSQFQKLKNSNDIIFAKRRAVCADINVAAQKPESHPELSKEAHQFINECIKDNILFSSQPDEVINTIIPHFFTRILKKDEIVIKQGDEQASEFYVIADGECNVLVNDNKVATLSKGKCFGEVALMYNAPRNATVSVKSNACKVYVMQRQSYRYELIQHQRKTDETHFAFLRSVEIFRPLLANELTLIDMSLSEQTYPANTVLFKQGDAPSKFYIVKEGSCDGHVANDDTEDEIFNLKSGHFFGELALLNDEPRKATITSGEKGCVLLELTKEEFLELLGPLKDILSRNAEEYKKPVGERKKSKKKICTLSELKTIGLLGRGAFGKVTLVIDPHTDQSYALKAIKKKQVEELGQSAHIVNEKKVMMLMNSKFLVNLCCTFKDDWRVYLLLDVCLGGELFTILRKKRSFNENETQFYSACVVEAFDYMHSMDIIYRDLKPENLVMDTDGYLKVTDFGFAKVVPKKTYTLCGTPDYLAPEIVTGQGHGKGVDWWCLGVLIYELLSSFPPFFDDEPMGTYKKIIQGKFKFPKYFTPGSRDLIARLLRTRPTKRLPILKGGADNVRTHNWYKESKFDWNALRDGSRKAPYVPKVKSVKDISNFDQRDARNSEPCKGRKPQTDWDHEF